MNGQPFRGPLFIVGMPRSGTKLLRDLLNRHSRISVPVCESLFIPSLIKKYGQVCFSDDGVRLTQCLDAIWKSSFIWYLGRQSGVDVDRDRFESALRADETNLASLAALLEFVFRRFSEKGYGDELAIWGDKTPRYLRHMRPLKDFFPSARFIHIARDPRDYALSMRKTWNKNIYRAAARWGETICGARRDAVALGEDYMEVAYEDLLANPVSTMTRLCHFAGVRFEDDCIMLDRPSEKLGDAKGKCYIDPRNTSKYKRHLNEREIHRVEEICLPTMRELGYRPDHAANHRPLSTARRGWYRLVDGFHLGLFRVREHGVLEGFSLCGKLLAANSRSREAKAE